MCCTSYIRFSSTFILNSLKIWRNWSFSPRSTCTESGHISWMRLKIVYVTCAEERELVCLARFFRAADRSGGCGRGFRRKGRVHKNFPFHLLTHFHALIDIEFGLWCTCIAFLIYIIINISRLARTHPFINSRCFSSTLTL